jgi:chemosensory pili system protein ChpA (sensor histidine kinase/response regulator)
MGELGALAGQFAQVQGALMIMELTEAANLNAAVMARVQQFAEGSLDGKGEAAEMVAEGLSALGLYITALQQGSAQPREVLLPALVHFGLVEPTSVVPESEVLRTGTVSPLDIDVQKQKVQALYEDWKEAPQETQARDKLERAVGELQRDAAVVSDAAVAQQSATALDAIKQTFDPDQTGLFRAIQGLAPDKPTETPAAQVVQLVDAPGAEVDAELLGIFLEEASEVLATIGDNVHACRDAPHDREALTTIRRGFHTLKGSGRMVGLTELGEMAWQCEQVMNKWLKDDKPATLQLLGFIELARKSFSGWIGELKDSGAAHIEGTPITQLAEQLKSEHPEGAPVEAAPAPVAEPEPLAFESVGTQARPETPAPQIEPLEAAFTADSLFPDKAAAIEEPAPAAAAPVEPPAFTFESLDLTPPAAETAPVEAPVEEPVAEPLAEFVAEPVAEPVAEWRRSRKRLRLKPRSRNPLRNPNPNRSHNPNPTCSSARSPSLQRSSASTSARPSSMSRRWTAR